MTYRERRLARAERLRGWAADREQRATAQLNSQPELRRDWAFISQPGHIPARARMNAADDRAHESLSKAAAMERRADGIEAAAEKAIYSDDVDAAERLTQKIAALEEMRDHAKAVNKAIRAAQRTTKDTAAILAGLVAAGTIHEKEAMRLASDFAMFPYHGLGYPAYHITNLGANIRRQKERLEEVNRERTEGPPWRYFHAARYTGTCLACSLPIEKGTPIMYRRGTDEVQHYPCYQKEPAAETRQTGERDLPCGWCIAEAGHDMPEGIEMKNCSKHSEG